jgi:hypothetical protein
MYCNGVVLKEN